jgi:hypothetical protein
MSMFRRYTIFVPIVLAVVVGIAWFSSPGEHFARVALACSGYLLGWSSAWIAYYVYLRKEPNQ